MSDMTTTADKIRALGAGDFYWEGPCEVAADIAAEGEAALRAEVEALRAALVSAAGQLQRVHDDAFRQCAGHGLRTTDGRPFNLTEINRCEGAAISALAALGGNNG